jgi:hypothetical protein
MPSASKKIKVKNIEGRFLKHPTAGMFSAWYIPKDNLILKFSFAGHRYFFVEFFPYRLESDPKFKPPKFEEKELKKYYKPIINKIRKKFSLSAEYEMFYELGWVRFNYDYKILTITHNSKYIKKQTLNNFYEWTIENLKIKEVGIEDMFNNSIIEYDFNEFKNAIFAKKTTSDTDTISAVRNRLFGPGNYIYDDIVSFDELFNLIMDNLKCQKK